MASALDADRARRLSRVVRELGGRASFVNIMTEAARQGVLRRHETLRRYLDLLVMGGVMGVRLRDVGSVQRQQLYTVKSMQPKITVGLAVLRRHGLNWDVPESEMRRISTDFEGLARAAAFDHTLMGSLEDSLVQELYRDSEKSTGAASFVVAMLATRKVDLPYILKRADELHAGVALRRIFIRILRTTSSSETEVDASVFFVVRNRFLNIARQYSRSGFWKLVESKGGGQVALGVVEGVNDYDIVMAAGKQLGVMG